MPRPVFAFASLSATAAATLIGALLVSAPVRADSFNNTNSCLSGSVDPNSFAALDQDFNTDGWKEHSGVQIQSESEQVVLSVTDSNGTSICSNMADLTTQCRFKAGFASTFSIRIDSSSSVPANYSLCSF